MVYLAILLVIPFCLCDKFAEELLIVPLQSGHLNTVFKFTTQFEGADISQAEDWKHYHLFPRQLGEIIGHYKVQELVVSLTQGHWRYATWGYPVESSPSGALVMARFLPTVPVTDIDNNWEGLTSALAGLLCASLNTLDKTQGVAPQNSFQPSGVVGGVNLTSESSHLRYGLLPKENVCTENLTPWKKLLPCKDKKGLSVLLNSGTIQKYSSYQALMIKIRPVCGDPSCSILSTELSQSINLVFDPAVYNGQRGLDNTDWNLKHLFGVGIVSSCPLADTSQIFVDVTENKFTLTPEVHREISAGSGTNVRKFGVYDVTKLSEDGRIKNLGARHRKGRSYGIVHIPTLTVNRYLIGTGQERGGIRTNIRNAGHSPLTVVFLDVVPWYLRLYLHTLSITSAGDEIVPISTHYVPGVDRTRPYTLELVLILPPRSTVTVTIQFEHSILRWSEYPPDANHGFYVGSALLTARIPDNRNLSVALGQEDSTLSFALWGNPQPSGVVQLFTETLLVSLPTPDFSMPYNVICLACTVAALAFGPIHNITTKSLEVVQPGQEEKGLLGKLIDKVKSVFSRKGKKEEIKDESEEIKDESEENKDGKEDIKDESVDGSETSDESIKTETCSDLSAESAE